MRTFSPRMTDCHFTNDRTVKALKNLSRFKLNFIKQSIDLFMSVAEISDSFADDSKS